MSLADVTEGLRLADGSVVLPSGKVMKHNKQMVEVPSNCDAQRIVTATRRRIADLPSVPRTMNAVSVVLCYTLFGLADEEIAIATGMTVEQVGRVKMLEAYGSMQQTIVQQINENDASTVRSLFVAQSRAAATKLVDLVENGEDSIALAAAKDVLDRAGHRPADVVEHRHKMEGGLTIEVRRKDDTVQTPVIDVTPEVIDGAS